MYQQPHTESEAPPTSEQQGTLEGKAVESATVDEGKTSKKPRNRKRAIAIIVAIAIVVIAICIFALTYCPHDEWADATCTEPKTCVRCGKTEGEALGHDWKDATCTESKTCQRCGETEGDALGHKAGDWSSKTLNALNAKYKSEQKCSVCGTVLDSKEENVTSFVENGKFILSPSDFNDRLSFELLCIKDCKLSSKLETGSGSTLALNVYRSSSKKIAAAGFMSESSKATADDLLTTSSKTKGKTFANVVFFFTKGADSQYAAETLYAVIQAADPLLSEDSSKAKEIGSSCAEQLTSSNTSASVTENGITYTLAYSDNEWVIGMRVA